MLFTLEIKLAKLWLCHTKIRLVLYAVSIKFIIIYIIFTGVNTNSLQIYRTLKLDFYQ